MGWNWGSVAVLMYSTESRIVTANYLLISDSTPLLLTDMTGMYLAGGP